LRVPGNIIYLIQSKKNHLLPEIFDDYILNMDFLPYSALEANDYRQKLIDSKETINVTDFGAGSHKMKTNQRRISDIAKISGTSPEFGLLYQKLITHFGIKNILELGTSIGIGTMYFASASPDVSVTSVEACPETHKFAAKTLKDSKINNVNLICQDFDSYLDNLELSTQKFDMVFIDGNHKGQSLLKYIKILETRFLNSNYIIIADDINWSIDMSNAWEKICEQNSEKTCFNLFRCGIVFSGYDLVTGVFPINFVNNQSLL